MRRFAAWLLSLILALLAVYPAGAEVLTAPVTFYSLHTRCNAEVTLDEAWFAHSAAEYDHQLCQQSLLLAAAAFRLQNASLDYKDASIRQLLSDFGFENYRAYQYDEVPTGDTIANAFATKRMTDSQGEFTLVAICVSGAGYGDEWLSNFTIDDNLQHAGFTQAAETVLGRFISYVQEVVSKGERVKVWGMGFSRAAAVSNLLGGYLTELSWLGPDNVFIYTFATPNTTKTPVAYPNIINTVGAMDPVPYVPFSAWGYGKNGVTHYLTAMEVDLDYKAKADKAAQLFSELTSKDPMYSHQSGNWLIHHVMRLLNRAFPSTSAYRQNLQHTIKKAWSTRGNMSDKLLVLLDDMLASETVNEDISPEVSDLFTLLSDAIFGTLQQISGEKSTDWIGLFISGSDLIMEHFPAIYYSWLFSADTLEEITPPTDSYFQLTYSGNFDVEIMCDDPEMVVLSPEKDLDLVTKIDMGDRHYIIMPDGHIWGMSLTAKEETSVAFDALRGTLGTVETIDYSSTEITLFAGDTVDVLLCTDPSDDSFLAYAALGNSLIEMSPGRTDLSVGGGRSMDRLIPMVTSASLIIIPQYFFLLLLLFYCVGMGIRKLTRFHEPNPLVPCRPLGNILMLVFSFLCLSKGLEHIAYLIIELTGRTPAVQMHKVAMQAAAFLNYGQAAYEGCSALLYLLLASTCFRARIRQRTRIRCMLLAIVLQMHDLLELLAAILLGQNLLKGILGVLAPILLMISIRLCRVHGTPNLVVNSKEYKL